MKKYLFLALALVAIAAIAGGYYFGIQKPHNEAVEQFENAKSLAESTNSDLQSLIEDADALLSSKSEPFDAATLDNLKSSVFTAQGALIVIPEITANTADIITAGNKLSAPSDLALEESAFQEATTAFGNSVKQLEQITNPSEKFVVERLSGVATITGVQAVTEENDPNGNLNKPSGYTAAVYFADSQVTEDMSGTDTIDNGTSGRGSIEVYATVEDAEKRNTYPSAFEGSGFPDPGSHNVYGTVVIRTSEHLTATQQQALEN